ncbi:CoA-binding protein [Fontivita pretiosa]|uniref:CoA-binding protein n=1 Tax=Fontivita pretiosa TaxID=2989684 RepID=UPI003D18766C
MSGNVMPFPDQPEQQAAVEQLATIRRMLAAQRIAIVGLSDDPDKPSHRVARYLRERARKQIIPVNPNHQSVLGLKCYPSLEQVPGQIDLVNVFRQPRHCADVVRSAIRLGIKAVWLQLGIRSAEARQLACDAGIDYVEDRCIMTEHLSGLVG